MHRFLWFCVFAASLGGFLVGYQTAVIAGAMLFIKNEFLLSAGTQGVVVSIILLGGLLGALFTCISLFALFFVWRWIPETKGKSCDEIQRLFNKD